MYYSAYVNVYFYSSLYANTKAIYIYEVGEVANGLRMVTLTRSDDTNDAYQLADSAGSKSAISKNLKGEDTPINNIKLDLSSEQYFLSGTEFIFEGVDEE
jgi:hypothetical protein